MTKLKNFFKKILEKLDILSLNIFLFIFYGPKGKELTEEDIAELYRLIDEDDYEKPKKKRSFKK